MAFSIVVALAKLSVFGGAPRGLTLAMAMLIWPLVLKFVFSFLQVRGTFINMPYNLILFFQMGQISLSADPGGGDRWQRATRATRLVFESLAMLGVQSPRPPRGKFL